MKWSRPCSAPAGKTLVRGSGNFRNPKLAFIGESPGDIEAKEGFAFSSNGKSGRLLRSILAELEVDPRDCYFDNVCMCHLGTKNPTPEDIECCYDSLIETLDRVNPKVIVLMGNVPAKTLGEFSKGISTVRGTWKRIRLAKGYSWVIPTYHPAGVLRSPDIFRDLVNDIDSAVKVAIHDEPAVIPIPYHQYDLVKTQEHLDEVFPLWEKTKYLAVDLETESKYVYRDDIMVIGIGYAKGRASSVRWSLFSENEANLKRLNRLLSKAKCIFQTSHFDMAWLWSRGVYPNQYFDTEVAHWLLDEREVGHGLESMAIRYLKAPPWKTAFRQKYGLGHFIKSNEEFMRRWTSIPEFAMMRYNAADADYTRQLYFEFRHEIKSQGMWSLLKLLQRACELYIELFLDGLDIDLDNLDALDKSYTAEIERTYKQLIEMAPHVNPNSHQQLAKYLYDELKLTTFGGLPADGKPIPANILSAALLSVEGEDADADNLWKSSRVTTYSGGTKGGNPGVSSRSTALFNLYWLKRQHPYPDALIRYRRTKKRHESYVAGFRREFWQDQKIHPEYRLVGNLHGRFRSFHPTIHTVPNEPDLYNLFRAPLGWLIVHSDYAQADLRLIAHISDDENMREWLERDPHFEVVKVIQRMTDEELLELKKTNPNKFTRFRLAAKMINFGAFYGRGVQSMAPQLGLTVRETKRYMDNYWARIPKARAWMNSRYDDLIANNQEYTSPFGNKRRFPLLTSAKQRRHAGSLGVNFPIMSSINYLTTLSHIRSVESIRAAGIPCRVYPHIHDSINVAVPQEHLFEAAQLVAQSMSQVPIDYGFDRVDWPVEVDAGTHWGHLHPVDLDGPPPTDLTPYYLKPEELSTLTEKASAEKGRRKKPRLKKSLKNRPKSRD